MLDGRTPAPRDKVVYPITYRVVYIQVVVWDFFHQQHLPSHMDILDIYLKFREVEHVDLVGGFNPSEKYESNWISSPK